MAHKLDPKEIVTVEEVQFNSSYKTPVSACE